MNRYLNLLVILLLMVISNVSYAGIKRQIVAEKKEEVKIDKQWAVFIGVSKYKEWQALKNPVKDVKETADILEKKYYFDEVIELYDENASAENILKTFSRIKNEANVNDSVFIYYAGHGGYSEVTNTGYWIPVDAGTDKIKRQNWISVSEIKSFFLNLKARHLFLVVDACYGNEFIESSRGKPEDIDNEFLRKGYQRISRQVLVSGVEDSVTDNSDFAMQLKAELNANTKQFLDPVSLYESIKPGVKKSTPMVGNIDGTGYQKDSSYVMFLRTKEDQELVLKKIEEENIRKKKEEERLRQEAYNAKPYNYITFGVGTIVLNNTAIKDTLETSIIADIGYKGKVDKIKYNIDLMAGYLANKPVKSKIKDGLEVEKIGRDVIPETTTTPNSFILAGIEGSGAYEFLKMDNLLSLYGGVGLKAAFTNAEKDNNFSDIYLKAGVDFTPQNYLISLDYRHGLFPLNDIGQVQLSFGWGWK